MKESTALLAQDPGSRPPAPSAGSSRPCTPLQLVVPYTDAELAARALDAALDLARGLDAEVTLMAVHVLPYPAPLECQEGVRRRLEGELAALVRPGPVAIRAQIVFARSRDEGYLGMLPPRPVVVVGVRRRLWRTPEERLARRLAAAGHSTAMIGVK